MKRIVLDKVSVDLQKRKEYGLAGEVILARLSLNTSIIASPNTYIIKATNSVGIVGSLHLGKLDDRNLKLYNMYVSVGYRGRGIASALINVAKQKAKEIRCNIELTPIAENANYQDKLEALYRSHGFVHADLRMIWKVQADDDNLSPDAYRQKHDRCPDGYIYDEEKRRCIKHDTKTGIPGPSVIDSPSKPGPNSPGPMKVNKSPAMPGPRYPDRSIKPINERERLSVN